MAENSGIQWTTHTFNPWRGCQKVAQGCKFCYAEKLVNGRMQGDFAKQRVKLSDAGWREPLKWNRDAQCNCGAAGTGGVECAWCAGGCHRPRVFCASLADVFEDWQGGIVDHNGHELWVAHSEPGRYVPASTPFNELLECEQQNFRNGHYRKITIDDLRADLFRLIDATPNLDWLLLTKRPENMLKMWPIPANGKEPLDAEYLKRPNVWLGTSVANQDDADKNIPELLKCRDLAPVLFVSYEPALDGVQFDVLRTGDFDSFDCLTGTRSYAGRGGRGGHETSGDTAIDWLIVGGESGHNARACDVAWIRSAIQQCAAADVPCFVKQLGSNAFTEDGNVGQLGDSFHTGGRVPWPTTHAKGGDMSEWPEDLRVREFPQVTEATA